LKVNVGEKNKSLFSFPPEWIIGVLFFIYIKLSVIIIQSGGNVNFSYFFLLDHHFQLFTFYFQLCDKFCFNSEKPL